MIESDDLDAARRALIAGCASGNGRAVVTVATCVRRLDHRVRSLSGSVPVLNPDALTASTRGNANRLDLIRNFPWRRQQLSRDYYERHRPYPSPPPTQPQWSPGTERPCTASCTPRPATLRCASHPRPPMRRRRWRNRSAARTLTPFLSIVDRALSPTRAFPRLRHVTEKQGSPWVADAQDGPRQSACVQLPLGKLRGRRQVSIRLSSDQSHRWVASRRGG